MYCDKCCIVFDDTRCPHCGRKRVREPKENDPCYLTTQNFVTSAALEDILSQNDIPCYKQGMMGAGLTMKFGSFNEQYRFFVPYACLKKSRELTEFLLAPASEIPEN